MAANQPPHEAVKQSDGSYMLQCEDGSTMRWTRRPDGSWRKPEHKRAGWVGELEQTKYVSKGAEIEQQRQAQMQAQVGRVPGAPPDQVAVQGNVSQASKKNEKKKEKRREKAEENEQLRLAGPVGEAVEEREDATVDAMSQEAVAGKNEKALRKKLRQIEELEEKQRNGEALNEDQLSKVAGRAKLEAELKAVLAGEPIPVEKPQAAPAAASSSGKDRQAPSSAAGYAAAPQSAPAAAPAQDATAAQKSRKAIEKKLRQIAEIEQKQKDGEALNDDQISKLSSKKELEAELKTCG